MPIQIIEKDSQATGMFDNGKIKENKPLGFPHDGGMLKPYSNLFYWANAWSDKGGLIALHPHRGFEIMSVVLQGTISHFDTSKNEWLDISEGDVQLIRAGNGISHAEKMGADSRMFQIWFDPNLEKTWNKPASYDFYKLEAFELNQENGYRKKILKGPAGPISMDTEGVEISELFFNEGKHKITLKPDAYYSFYLLEGSLKVLDQVMKPDDFMVASKELEIDIETAGNTRLFVVSNPVRLGFKTYAELNG